MGVANPHDPAQAALAVELKARIMSEHRHQLELYSLSRHRQIGDDVLWDILGELDLSEVNLGQVR